MKFLLAAINAKYIHSNPAIYSLKAYAGEQYAGQIETAEYTINEKIEDILEKIYQAKPDAIGLSCYIWNINVVEALLLDLPKILPQTDIWLGGPEVSFDAESWVQKYPQLTGVMVGEGEGTFREVMECYSLEGEKDFSGIPGLCLPSGYTALRPPLDLSTIPFIYGDMEIFRNRIIYYESSRGCPYSCSYCLSSVDKKVRLRDIRLVERELQFFLDNKVPQVKFVDRTFNCNREHTRRIWTYLSDHDNGITNFHFEVSADILNTEELELLRSLRPGLVQLEIGVQSTNIDTIHEIHRVMDVEKLAGIVATIKAGHNVHQHLDLIVGLPHENYESFGRSFDRVYAMEPDQLQMGFLKMLKGSFMHMHGQEYGIRYTEKAPYEVLYTDWISYDDVRKLKRIEEMVEQYYNSNQFMHTLPYLISFCEGAFAFFEALAMYYHDQGYEVNTPSRIRRYELLLEFGDRMIDQNSVEMAGGRAGELSNEEQKELLRELLTYDLFLRENMKSRPAFAAEVTGEMKDGQRAFYREEAKTHQYLPDYSELDSKQLGRQTHMEWFHYPVWEKEAWKYARQKAQAVLFDYRNRDPLDYDARIVVLGQGM